MAEPNWLNPREARAWRGYMRMRALLDLQINRDLAEDSGLSSADYQVLATLSETEGQSLRLFELAERMLWSKSRLAHHLDRMAARGLVRRQEHATKSRGTVITLTEHGLSTIERAAPAHVDSVRRHFIDLLTEDQIDALGEATHTVIAHLADPVSRER
ncbi:MarR family winged helix-turn-helix transcriptional regulator [Amycolatopsis aidingensis]|uniref:MarR family winged helix-turn-helix transcriptional regulator n=1 Tax=Amycolatopsis aidingensis TaxID=2842453 RepID=UPI001E5F16E2|nr:MarR family winged helix-turn-helix transcriptional regulator [Amycolatopsis aidingensis]